MFPPDELKRIEVLFEERTPARFGNVLRPEFLHVLDRLRAVADQQTPREPDATAAIKVWQGFATLAGFTEAELRAEARVERRKAAGGEDVVGCGWYKCIMVGRDEVMLFRCAGCQKTLYCALKCQQR